MKSFPAKNAFASACLLSVVLLLQIATSHAGEIITAEGMAAIIGWNTVVARDKAIDDASACA